MLCTENLTICFEINIVHLKLHQQQVYQCSFWNVAMCVCWGVELSVCYKTRCLWVLCFIYALLHLQRTDSITCDKPRTCFGSQEGDLLEGRLILMLCSRIKSSV